MAKSRSASKPSSSLDEDALRRLDIARRRADCMTERQLSLLRKHFEENTHPSMDQRRAIAKEIGRDVGKVSNWFGNQRREPRRLTSKKTRWVTARQHESLQREENESSSAESNFSTDTDVDIPSPAPLSSPSLSPSPCPRLSIPFSLNSVDPDVLQGAILLYNLRYPSSTLTIGAM